MVKDRGAVIEYAGNATIVTCGVVLGMLLFACCLNNSKSVMKMFGFSPRDIIWDTQWRYPYLSLCNTAVSIVFCLCLSDLVNSARNHEEMPPLTSMFLLWVSMFYLFAFFGIRFLVDEFGMLQGQYSIKFATSKEKPEQGVQFGKFPDELLVYICTFVQYSEVVRLGTTSKKMLLVSQVAMRQLETFVVQASSHSNFELTKGSLFEKTKEVSQHPFNDAALLRVVKNCFPGKLKNLSLRGSEGLTQDGIYSSVVLFQANTIVGFDAGFCSSAMTNFSLCTLIGFHNVSLARVELDGCEGISQDGFNSLLSTCTGLRYISVKCTAVDDMCLNVLAQNNSGALEYLDLSECPFVSDPGIELIASRFPHISGLILDASSSVSRITDDSGAGVFKACKSLSVVSFRNCSITDESIISSQRLCNFITRLDLSNTQITDVGLCYILPSVPLLRALLLNACQGVTDMSLQVVALHCTKLQQLELIGSPVSCAGLDIVSERCSLIETVNIAHNCMLTEEDILGFVNRSACSLRTLNLSGCRNVTLECVSSIDRLYPDLTIYYGYDRYFSKRNQAHVLKHTKRMVQRMFLGQLLALVIVARLVY
mmetsp:Transcript_20620/g.33587  ORF Transcript_20620/g.33587 Transcript_20620/m.33587 type:complete len:595 (+) Transcript_20620:138-1922(+)